MIDSTAAVTVMNDDDLIASTREIARKSNGVEAELLLYLGEIDAKRIYRERAAPSMIAFCMREFNFSEGAAFNRIFVARAARKIPAMLDALRSGAVHLTGLRILISHLDEENHQNVLAQAAGKSKREIEEFAAALSPRPPVSDAIRKNRNRELALAAPTETAMSVPPPREERRAIIAPLSADTFTIQFTGSRAFRDKLGQAQDLLRHRIPNGDLAQVFEKALDTLIAKVLKERFAIGRKPRRQLAPGPVASERHEAPDPMKRAVYERDEGRCAFVDENGNRCPETSSWRSNSTVASSWSDCAATVKRRRPPRVVQRRHQRKCRLELVPGQASSDVCCRAHADCLPPQGASSLTSPTQLIRGSQSCVGSRSLPDAATRRERCGRSPPRPRNR